MQIKGPRAGGGWRLRIAASAGLTGVLLALTPGLDATSVAADVGAPVEGASGPLDEDAASAKAVRTDEEVEADQLATPTTRVVALPAGGFRAEISALPSRVQDADGEWQSVDNTLIRTAEGEITPKRPAAPMTFSAGGDDALARIMDDERSLAVSWPGGDLPEPELVGSAAHYRDVLPGVDLVAQAGPTGFATFVVVESREAAMNPAVRDLALDVEADGVNVADTSTGGLEAKDGTETVFTAAQPLMWDSEGVTDRVEQSFSPEEKAVDAALTPPLAAEPVEMPMQASNTEISLAVPEQVLDDPKTIYPVILDPGITTAGIEYGGWTMLWSNGTTMYNHPTEMARVGYDGWSGSPKKSRSFFHMDVPLNTLEGATITGATFTHRQIHSPQHTCDVNYGPAVQVHRTERFTSSHTWSNQPAVLSSQSENAFGHGNEAYCTGFDRQSFNVLSGVKEAVAAGKDLTLRMKSADETDRNGWRKYDNTQLGYPELSITYYIPVTNSAPQIGDMTADDTDCFSGELASIVTRTEPLLAAPVFDQESNGITSFIELADRATGALIRTTSVGPVNSGATMSWSVPSASLANGGTYKWRARASDGVSTAAYTDWCNFDVDTDLAEASPYPEGCDESARASGACLPTAAFEGESPVQAAVSLAIENGELAKAEEFVTDRGEQIQDSDQDAIEQILLAAQNAPPAPTDPDAIIDPDPEGPTPADSESPDPQVTISSDGSGTAFRDRVGRIWYLGYCRLGSCTYHTFLYVWFNYDITSFPYVSMWGEVSLLRGPKPVVNKIECRTRENRNNKSDKNWNFWSNCPSADHSSPASQWNVLSQTWNHLGPSDVQDGNIPPRNKWFHNDYYVRAIAQGTTYSKRWSSRDYKVPEAPSNDARFEA